ncbi:MAG: hypothetical protein Q9159_003897 [Coniocarpon cinnabarinum]
MDAVNQEDTLPEVQAFLQWVPTRLRRGVASTDAPFQDFLPYPDLEAYFTEDDNTRLRAIVGALCPPPKHFPSQIATNIVKFKYLKGFATLLMIGEGRHIERFAVPEELCDARLPFKARPNAFPASNQGDSFEKFKKHQWIFLPAFMEAARQQEIEVERILPILSQSPLGTGGSAQVSRIELHPYYNHLSSYHESQPDPTSQNNTFVLKTYHPSEGESSYYNETQAFQHLRNTTYLETQSFITYYTGYEHLHAKSQKTFNIILEYADGGDLEDMFQTQDEPRSPSEIASFWLRFLDVLKALRSIHNIKVDGNRGNRMLNGWHQDIKPKNIYLVRNGRDLWDSDFKLADLGLAHLRPRVGLDAAATDKQGTKTYGAPECYREDTFAMRAPRTIDPTVDCWSLGAVLCETMVWVVGGLKELTRFREKRRAESNSIPNHQDPGAFHDSKNHLLSCVASQLEMIKSDIRTGDKVTEHVLRLVQECMLVPILGRTHAGHIWSRWHGLRPGIEQFLNGESDKVDIAPNSPPQHAPETRSQTMPAASNQRQSRSSLPNDIVHRPSSQSPPLRLVCSPSARTAPPTWLRSEADRWFSDHLSDPQAPYDDSQAFELIGRDHVFLLDNSFTMRDHWKSVGDTVQLLSEILFTLRADDRIDVELVAKSDRRPGKCCKKKSRELKEFIEANKPPNFDSRQLNVGLGLSEYLRGYQSRISSRFNVIGSLLGRGKKPLSLYVLTDGRYQQNSELKQPIRNILDTVAEKSGREPHWPRSRKYVGIQFIQFGHDPEGTRRLDELDKFTRVEKLWSDIVDTEPADGNVWKMLLGPINDTFDDDGGGLTTSPTGHAGPAVYSEDPFASPARRHTASNASTFGGPMPDRMNTGVTAGVSVYPRDSLYNN